MKLAKLKTILRKIGNKNEVIDVFDGNLDDNSVSTINIVNQSITSEKILDESLDFSKIDPEAKYISTKDSDISLVNVGGIVNGENISNITTRDLLKKIIMPEINPIINVRYKLNTDNRNNTLLDDKKSASNKVDLYKNNIFGYITISVTQRYKKIKGVSTSIIVQDNGVEKTIHSTSDEFSEGSAGFESNQSYTILQIDNLEYTINSINSHVFIYVDIDYADGNTEQYSVDITPYSKIFYGNSDISITKDNDSNITTNISALFTNGFNSGITINDDNTNYTMIIIYPTHTDKYSYILIPSEETSIKTAVDTNNNIQSIEYVGKTTYTINKITVPYKMFRTGRSTTTIEHTYRFNIEQE